MNELFEIYKENMIRQGCFAGEDLPASRFFSGMRFSIKPQLGRGWAELVQNDNGLCVSLCDYTLTEQMEGESFCDKDILHFGLLLSGSFDFQLTSNKKASVVPGEIWLCRGINHACFSQPSNQQISGIGLNLPISLVESWLGDSCLEKGNPLEIMISQRKNTYTSMPSIAQSVKINNRILQSAKGLFYIDRSTLYDKLHFESQCLELLAQIFSLYPETEKGDFKKQNKIKTAVDDALDILKLEYACAPTISGLARRVGVNECYLKSGFRKYTGLSIGEYVRKKRMGRALELITSGEYSILDTAQTVGYSNPSHFSAAFKRFYGHLPSYYV